MKFIIDIVFKVEIIYLYWSLKKKIKITTKSKPHDKSNIWIWL